MSKASFLCGPRSRETDDWLVPKAAAPGSYTGGRIINIASMAGLRVLPQIGAVLHE